MIRLIYEYLRSHWKGDAYLANFKAGGFYLYLNRCPERESSFPRAIVFQIPGGTVERSSCDGSMETYVFQILVDASTLRQADNVVQLIEGRFDKADKRHGLTIGSANKLADIDRRLPSVIEELDESEQVWRATLEYEVVVNKDIGE